MQLLFYSILFFISEIFFLQIFPSRSDTVISLRSHYDLFSSRSLQVENHWLTIKTGFWFKRGKSPKVVRSAAIRSSVPSRPIREVSIRERRKSSERGRGRRKPGGGWDRILTSPGSSSSCVLEESKESSEMTWLGLLTHKPSWLVEV